MIQLTDDQLAEVTSILATTPFECWVFGSRARGTARPDSDLDICLRGDVAVTLEELGRLREAFEESHLPFVVDLVDFKDLPDFFRQQVLADGIRIQTTARMQN